MVIFCKILIIFLRRNTVNSSFLDVTNKENKKSHMASLLKSIYYELGAIKLYLEGVAISISTIY